MKPVYLAKEREGSIIEVQKSGRDWVTTDGRCLYQHGSFEWTLPMRALQAALRVNGEGLR